METKDYFIIGLGLLGWLWGVIQFNLNRRYQKKDKVIDKKFEVYSNFMNKMDQMNSEIRNDPNSIIQVVNKLYPEIISGDEERSNNALIKMNEVLLNTVQKSMKPMIIINQELNNLRLVASPKLLPKINEYKILINEFTDEFQQALDFINVSSNLEKNAKLIEDINQPTRNDKLKILWYDIENLMREEIGYYK
ncbi:hypothetical protein HX063_17430 [Myroides odoratimimus]|uniref:hypothetical protein n=1 Tax=Myroides odoratimimus TaxID=76832 RepID=UPI0025750118|nr:hypothetical protein [Myroides odoratimimus]MDM1497149.1 hypothetical protein [Myroides odoratimimus]